MTDEPISLTKRLKQEIDELVVQLSLGKAEAADFIEDQKKRFRFRISDVKAKVAEAEKAGAAAGAEKARALKQKLDELEVQLALGRMETRESYEEQKAKISQAVEKVRDEFKPVEESVSGALSEAKEKFHEGSEEFKTRLDALALNLGVGKIIAEEELKLKKDALKQDLKELSSKLGDVAGIAGEGLKKLGSEALDTFSEIRKKLRE